MIDNKLEKIFGAMASTEQEKIFEKVLSEVCAQNLELSNFVTGLTSDAEVPVSTKTKATKLLLKLASDSIQLMSELPEEVQAKFLSDVTKKRGKKS